MMASRRRMPGSQPQVLTLVEATRHEAWPAWFDVLATGALASLSRLSLSVALAPAAALAAQPPGDGCRALKADRRAAEKQRRASPGNLVGHGGPIKALAVDAATGRALTGSFDYAMMVWDVAAEEPRAPRSASTTTTAPSMPWPSCRAASWRWRPATTAPSRSGTWQRASSPIASWATRQRSSVSPYRRTAGGRPPPAGTARRACGTSPSSSPAPCCRAITGPVNAVAFSGRRQPRLQRQRRRHDRAVERGRRQLPAAALPPWLGHQRAGAAARRRAAGVRRRSTARWRWWTARRAQPSWSLPAHERPVLALAVLEKPGIIATAAATA